MARIDKGSGVSTRSRAKKGDRAALSGLPVVQSNMEISLKLKQDIRNAERGRRGHGRRRRRRESGSTTSTAPERARPFALLNAQLDQEMQQVVASAKNRRWLMAKSQGRLRSRGSLEQQKQEINSQNKTGIYYDALKREVDSNRQLFDTLLQRAKETGVTSEFKGSSIEIVDKAEMPRSPIYPRTGRDLMVGFMGELRWRGATGLAFGFEYMDSRIRTPDEMLATSCGSCRFPRHPSGGAARRGRQHAAHHQRGAGDVR